MKKTSTNNHVIQITFSQIVTELRSSDIFTNRDLTKSVLHKTGVPHQMQRIKGLCAEIRNNFIIQLWFGGEQYASVKMTPSAPPAPLELQIRADSILYLR